MDIMTLLMAKKLGGSGGGLTNTARTLLMTVLRNGVYTSDQSANLAALEEALKSSGGGSDEPDVPVEPDEPDVPGVVEEELEWKLVNSVDNNTYVPGVSDKSAGSSAKVYCTGVAVGPISSDGNAELRFTLDTTKVAWYRFRLYIYNEDGTPYKASGPLGDSNNQVSGDLSNISLSNPGNTGRVYVNGDWSYKIPNGHSVLVQAEFAGANTNGSILDESLLDANGNVYGLVDAIVFNGEVLHAYVVREG